MGDRQVRHYVEMGINHLSKAMVEISLQHLVHPNNSVPHFPVHCLGSVDTFPIFIDGGFGRFQPKYKGSVVKFMAIVSHQGVTGMVDRTAPGDNV